VFLQPLNRQFSRQRLAIGPQQAGLELDIDPIFNRILERTFEFLTCDRAMILTIYLID